MGVSIYYAATRPEPLSPAERRAVAAAIDRHPLAALLEECGIPAEDFNGEDFCVYPAGDADDPSAVFEGATKLPLCSESVFWSAIQHWCRLLTVVRRAIPGSAWHVHVDDLDIPWNEEDQAFTPATE